MGIPDGDGDGDGGQGFRQWKLLTHTQPLLPHAPDLFVWLDFAIAVAEHALLAALANYRQWILYTGKKNLTQAKEFKFF